MESEKDIKAAVESRVKAEEAALDTTVGNDPEITPAFIYDCYSSSELGDGILYSALYRGRFLFDKNAGVWYRWAGHYFETDILDTAFHAVEGVVKKYLELIDSHPNNEELRLKILRRVKRLRTVSGARNCLEMAHKVKNGLAVSGTGFDDSPWLLACRNVVVELRTGRARAGRPDDLLVKAAPHEWSGIDTPAPAWEKFLNDIFDGDKDLIDYVHRLLGYGITGLVREHVFAVLYGEGGRNGKSVLAEIMGYILGPLAQPIQSEMLLDQRHTRSSSGPSPDIMSLKGLRIAFASETDEGRRFSASRAKLFSGGDKLTGRNPHDRFPCSFSPTHLLCLLTNTLPHAPGDDLAFWARMHLIPFNIRFVENPTAPNERPRDKDLQDKLRAEAPGILAWLVRGCIEWYRQGLNPPPVVLSAAAAYQRAENLLSGFVEVCCYPPHETDPSARVKFGELFDAFEVWYGNHIGDARFCPKKRKFSSLLEKAGFKKERIGGVIYAFGLELRGQDEE